MMNRSKPIEGKSIEDGGDGEPPKPTPDSEAFDKIIKELDQANISMARDLKGWAMHNRIQHQYKQLLKREAATAARELAETLGQQKKVNVYSMSPALALAMPLARKATARKEDRRNYS